MDKYRIVEHHHKFYVERLERILFWKTYIPVSDESLSLDEQHYMHLNGTSPTKIFNTLDDAKKYIKGCKKKYHKCS